MSRVELGGQFNVDAALCSGSSTVAIERRPPSIPSTSTTIRHWNGFCDAVDRSLAPLSRIRAVAKVSSFLLYVVIALYVFGIQLLPRVTTDFDYGILKYSGFVIFPVFVAYGVVYCTYVRGGLARVMNQVKQVCEQYSTKEDGVAYKLESEHWGGCNKPHVKRWYIVVDINDEEANNFARGQKDTGGGATTASEYFSSPATSPDFSPEQPVALAVAVPERGYPSTQNNDVRIDDTTPTSRLAEMLK